MGRIWCCENRFFLEQRKMRNFVKKIDRIKNGEINGRRVGSVQQFGNSGQGREMSTYPHFNKLNCESILKYTPLSKALVNMRLEHMFLHSI